mmetsp:Transcript_29857/g.75971  ORF Transcript_29857/g.75971 Transcript_29857/m.75971 type:complete len:259 (+) Transcript_29857:784-1560(+)
MALCTVRKLKALPMPVQRQVSSGGSVKEMLRPPVIGNMSSSGARVSIRFPSRRRSFMPALRRLPTSTSISAPTASHMRLKMKPALSAPATDLMDPIVGLRSPRLQEVNLNLSSIGMSAHCSRMRVLRSPMMKRSTAFVTKGHMAWSANSNHRASLRVAWKFCRPVNGSKYPSATSCARSRHLWLRFSLIWFLCRRSAVTCSPSSISHTITDCPLQHHASIPRPPQLATPPPQYDTCCLRSVLRLDERRPSGGWEDSEV